MPSKISAQYTGGVVDESLPKRALAIIAKLPDAERLAREIAALVGRYRQNKLAHKTIPADYLIVEHIDKMAGTEKKPGTIDHLLEQIESMPEETKARATETLLRTRGEDYESLAARLEYDLRTYKATIRDTLRTVQTGRESPGKKSKKQLEHRLLSDVAAILEPYYKKGAKTEAAGDASKLLNACGVHLPAEAIKARDAIVAYRKTR